MYFEISKKSNYAILALFELALRQSHSPLNVRRLAGANNLPVRFLEVILNELKQGGFVRSVRGKAGGYALSRSPKEITVGQVLNFLENKSSESEQADALPAPGQFVLAALMQQVNTAIGQIFECCTLDELVQREMEHRGTLEANYVI